MGYPVGLRRSYVHSLGVKTVFQDEILDQWRTLLSFEPRSREGSDPQDKAITTVQPEKEVSLAPYNPYIHRWTMHQVLYCHTTSLRMSLTVPLVPTLPSQVLAASAEFPEHYPPFVGFPIDSKTIITTDPQVSNPDGELAVLPMSPSRPLTSSTPSSPSSPSSPLSMEVKRGEFVHKDTFCFTGSPFAPQVYRVMCHYIRFSSKIGKGKHSLLQKVPLTLLPSMMNNNQHSPMMSLPSVEGANLDSSKRDLTQQQNQLQLPINLKATGKEVLELAFNQFHSKLSKENISNWGLWLPFNRVWVNPSQSLGQYSIFSLKKGIWIAKKICPLLLTMPMNEQPADQQSPLKSVPSSRDNPDSIYVEVVTKVDTSKPSAQLIKELCAQKYFQVPSHGLQFKPTTIQPNGDSNPQRYGKGAFRVLNLLFKVKMIPNG
jgi:hypothetical protein